MKIITILFLLIVLGLGGFWLYERYLKIDSDLPSSDYFSINAYCNGEKQCVYNGRDIDVNIVITNISSESIEMPIRFLEQRGPMITLINSDTERKLILPTNPPNGDLLNNRSVIGPGQTARLSWVITDREIREVAGDAVNITVNVQIQSPVHSNNLTAEETASSSFIITH